MVVMGRVVAPHGVRGWIRVRAYTEAADGLASYPQWWLGSASGLGAVERGGRRTPTARGSPRSWKAATIARQRSLWRSSTSQCRAQRCPETEADEYYWADLIGLQCAERRRRGAGHRELRSSRPAPTTCWWSAANGERLIPFIAPVIVEVDLAGGRLEGRLGIGLLRGLRSGVGACSMWT